MRGSAVRVRPVAPRFGKVTAKLAANGITRAANGITRRELMRVLSFFYLMTSQTVPMLCRKCDKTVPEMWQNCAGNVAKLCRKCDKIVTTPALPNGERRRARMRSSAPKLTPPLPILCSLFYLSLYLYLCPLLSLFSSHFILLPIPFHSILPPIPSLKFHLYFPLSFSRPAYRITRT